MLCEFLPGREFAFQSVWKDGEIICSMARERLEYLMGNLFPSGQSSSPSVAKTVHDERVNEIATKAIKRIDGKATGIFCVDLKEDRQGTPRVTEINAGRFFTTCDFFANCGVNMADLYVRLGMGKELPYVDQYNAVPEDIYWIRGVDTTPFGYMYV
jgi:carbamoyl-phosphate synthase large subunit